MLGFLRQRSTRAVIYSIAGLGLITFSEVSMLGGDGVYESGLYYSGTPHERPCIVHQKWFVRMTNIWLKSGI